VNCQLYNLVYADIYQYRIARCGGHRDLCYGATFSCCVYSSTVLDIEQFYPHHFVNSGLECEGDVSTFWVRNRCYHICSLDNKDSAKARARKRCFHVLCRSRIVVIAGIHETGKVFGRCVRAFDAILGISMNRKIVQGVVADVHMIPVSCIGTFVIHIEVNRFVVAKSGRRSARGRARRGAWGRAR
jgi:hypothetical protein